jgi:hypothetical protein
MDVLPLMKKEIIVTESDLPPQVVRAIEQGRKIEAIQLLREAKGIGLANAKVLVDKAARQHGPRSPVPAFEEHGTSLATLLKALLLAVLAFAFYRYYLSS